MSCVGNAVLLVVVGLGWPLLSLGLVGSLLWVAVFWYMLPTPTKKTEDFDSILGLSGSLLVWLFGKIVVSVGRILSYDSKVSVFGCTRSLVCMLRLSSSTIQLSRNCSNNQIAHRANNRNGLTLYFGCVSNEVTTSNMLHHLAHASVSLLHLYLTLFALFFYKSPQLELCNGLLTSPVVVSAFLNWPLSMFDQLPLP